MNQFFDVNIILDICYNNNIAVTEEYICKYLTNNTVNFFCASLGVFFK